MCSGTKTLTYVRACKHRSTGLTGSLGRQAVVLDGHRPLLLLKQRQTWNWEITTKTTTMGRTLACVMDRVLCSRDSLFSFFLSLFLVTCDHSRSAAVCSECAAMSSLSSRIARHPVIRQVFSFLSSELDWLLWGLIRNSNQRSKTTGREKEQACAIDPPRVCVIWWRGPLCWCSRPVGAWALSLFPSVLSISYRYDFKVGHSWRKARYYKSRLMSLNQKMKHYFYQSSTLPRLDLTRLDLFFFNISTYFKLFFLSLC